MVSTPSRRRLSSASWRRYGGKPSGIHTSGPVRSRPGLGRDDQAVVGMQRLADDLLGDVRAVGVGGVDEVDAEFDRAPQHADRFVAVGGRAPNALAGEAHGAEAEAVDGEIAAESERSGCVSGSLGSHLADRTPAAKTGHVRVAS